MSMLSTIEGPPVRRRLLVVLRAGAALAAVLGSASCAGDGPSLEAFVVSAEEICVDVQREADGLALPTAGPALADSMRTGAELSRDEVEALVDLPRPRQERDAVDAWLDALGRRVTALEAYAAELERAEPGAALPPVPDALAEATQDAAEQAQALGLDVCGAGVETAISAPTTVAPAAPQPGPAPVTVPGAGATTTVTNDIGIPPDETTTQDQ